jgi:Fe-S-cluster containining protein
MNCGIYRARPLVCRLFGFSATLGKNGEPEFSLCRHMTPPEGLSERKLFGRARLEELFGSLPPVMGHFSMEASSIDPECAGGRTSLAVAVPYSLSKIGLGSSLMSLQFHEGGTTLNPTETGRSR